MKKNGFFVGMAVMVLAFGMVVVGCISSSTSNSGRSNVPANMMTGTTWVYSEGAHSGTYTFIDSTTYRVSYTGGFAVVAEVAGLITGSNGYETGTYSVSNQTVTLKPAAGAYLIRHPDTKIVVKEKAESFTIDVVDDSFTLGVFTYRRVK